MKITLHNARGAPQLRRSTITTARGVLFDHDEYSSGAQVRNCRGLVKIKDTYKVSCSVGICKGEEKVLDPIHKIYFFKLLKSYIYNPANCQSNISKNVPKIMTFPLKLDTRQSKLIAILKSSSTKKVISP